MKKYIILTLSLLTAAFFYAIKTQDPVNEISDTLRNIANSMQTKKVKLLKQADMNEQALKTKSVKDLLDRSANLRGVARNMDFDIREAQENIDDPRGRCNNLGIWHKLFEKSTVSYCGNLKPSRVYRAEQEQLRNKASAIVDLIDIKQNEARINNLLDDLNNNKLALKSTYYAAKVMPKEQLAPLKEMDEQALRSKLTEIETRTKKRYDTIAETAMQRELNERELSDFVEQIVVNRIVKEEIESVIRSKQPVAKRVRDTFGSWFSPMEQTVTQKQSDDSGKKPLGRRTTSSQIQGPSLRLKEWYNYFFSPRSQKQYSVKPVTPIKQKQEFDVEYYEMMKPGAVHHISPQMPQQKRPWYKFW